MDLYILRHAIAVERTAPAFPTDSERPLTPDGLRKLKKAARGMKALGLTFDLILTSPYVRARDTAAVVARTLGLTDVLEESALLESGADLQALISHLASRMHGGPILLVGHEPMLSSLISLLVSGDEDLDIVMKKAGLCKLSIGRLSPGRCASLEWLLTPRHLASMG